MVDSSEPTRFEDAKAALERVLGSRELFGAPLLVIANKQDRDAAETYAAVTENLGLGKVDTRPFRVQPASALNGSGVAEGVHWLVEEVKRSSRALLLRQRAIGN